MGKKNLILLVLVPAAALALYAWQEKSTPLPPEEMAQAEPRAQIALVAPGFGVDAAAARPVRAPATVTVAPPSKGTFADMYAKAENNLEFIRQIYVAAQDGDAEAQFQLFSALKYCERYYRFYFVRGNSRKTLDEALAWATRSPGTSAEEAREVHRRCRVLMESHANEFGRADDWLAIAADNGHPEAQVALAEQLLIASILPPDEAALATEQDRGREQIAEAKDLLLLGLDRRDPSAVWKIGELQAVLKGEHDEADKDAWVWRLAACKLGYDCSQTADWYRFMCRFDPNCQPYETGVDFILRTAAATYPDVDLLSDELVEQINRGDLKELGWK